MSYKGPLSWAGIVALSLGFAQLSACSVAQSADHSGYYASIGNPHPVAYDTKREELLVPN